MRIRASTDVWKKMVALKGGLKKLARRFLFEGKRVGMTKDGSAQAATSDFAYSVTWMLTVLLPNLCRSALVCTMVLLTVPARRILTCAD